MTRDSLRSGRQLLVGSRHWNEQYVTVGASFNSPITRLQSYLNRSWVVDARVIANCLSSTHQFSTFNTIRDR